MCKNEVRLSRMQFLPEAEGGAMAISAWLPAILGPSHWTSNARSPKAFAEMSQ